MAARPVRARIPLRVRALAGDPPALPRVAPAVGGAPQRRLPRDRLGSLRRRAALPSRRRTRAGLEHRGADPRAGGGPDRDAAGEAPPRAQGVLTGRPGAAMTLTTALRAHWPEYAMEAAGLGAFMISACIFVVLIEHPDFRAHLLHPAVRRALVGGAMGVTAVALIYSPWGKRSGAHLTPAVTLAFWRLGRIPAHDALFYVLAQVAGGAAGVGAAWLVLGPRLAHSATHFAATVPGMSGVWVAFAAEVGISLVLMLVVLEVSASRFARWTGVCAGLLLASYIFLESPLSGTSMNPARSFGSALMAGEFGALWIYFLAPPAGMLVAAFLHGRRQACAKLDHVPSVRCIFCAQRPAPAERPKRIVILGGGFGGVFAAQQLEKQLRGRHDYEIVLVAKDNYFVFQPMLPEVISGTIGLIDLVSPLRRLLPATEIHVREIESIDLQRRTVTTAPGFLPH